jgi:NADH-quinone oxidoreductase subunit C
VTPEQLVAAVESVLGDSSTCSASYGLVTVDVPRSEWATAVSAVTAELGLTYFDMLTAVDELEAGFDVVLRLWAPAGRFGLLMRTRCARDDAHVPSLAGVFAGAAWHERQVWEMFDIGFDGHPELRRLLLPDGFEGHPLRKDFVLVSRVAKPWPGAKDPGESDADLQQRPRRRVQPPGVPRPGTWP